MKTKTLTDYENEAIRLLQECGTNNINSFNNRMWSSLVDNDNIDNDDVVKFINYSSTLAELLKAVTALEIISPDDLEYISSAPFENIHGNLGELGLYQEIYDECIKLKYEKAMLAELKEYIKT